MTHLISFLAIIALVWSCKTTGGSQLDAYEMKTASDGSIIIDSFRQDGGFCSLPRKPDECFTLIYKIPAKNLAKDVGLAFLGLMQESDSLRSIYMKNCHLGLQTYIEGYTRVDTRYRSAYFYGIKDYRCIVQFITDEDFDEIRLPPKQKGIAVEVENFNFSAYKSSTDFAIGKFNSNGFKLQTKVYKPQIWLERERTERLGWYFIEGNGRALSTAADKTIAHLEFKKSIFPQTQFSLGFSGLDFAKTAQAIVGNIQQGSNSSMSYFIKTASGALAGNIKDQFTMVGMGIQYASQLCAGENTDGQKKCSTKLSEEQLAESLGTSLEDLDPIDAATRNALRESFLIQQTYLLDELFSSGNGSFLNEVVQYHQ